MAAASPGEAEPPEPASAELAGLTGGGRGTRAAAVIGTLLVIAVALAVAKGVTAVGQTTVIGLVSGSYIAIGAVGLTLVYGGLRLVNFAHGDYMTFGAYMAVAGRALGMPLALATLFAVVLTAIGSVVIEFILWRPMRRRAPGFFQLVLVGFGLAFIIRYGIQFVAGANQRPLDVDTTKSYTFAGLHIGQMQLIVVIVGGIVIAAVIALLKVTSFGRQVRALSDSVSLSETTGIDTSRVIVLLWLLSGALAGLAGVLIAAPIGYITPELGFTVVLSVFAAAVIGAIGNPYGALLGGLLIGVVEEWSTLLLPAQLKPAIGFLAMIVVLIVRPEGLFGRPVGVGRR